MPAMLKTRAALLAATTLAFAAGMGSPPTSVADTAPALRGSTVTAGVPKHTQRAPTSPEQRAAWLRVRSNGAASRRFPGRGWPVAHDRRMARKRRNVIKARRAKRG